MEMKLFSTRYYKINKLFMQQVGIWPEQTLVKRIVYPLFLVISVASILIPEIIRMRDVWGDVDVILAGATPMLIISLGWVKLLNGIVRRPQLLDLLKRIDNDWTVLSVNESSMEILRTYAERGRTLTITYAIAVYMSVTSFTLLPAIPIVLNIVAPLNESRPKKMLYEAEYGVDDEKYYYYMLVHWYFTSFACICVFVTNDTMYSVWVQHCCALFAIVGNNLKNAAAGKEGEEIEYKVLCECIRQHKDAIIFANTIESIYSAALAYTTGVNMVVMSITGVLFVINMSDVEDALRFLCLNAGQVYHLWFNTIPGQRLLDHSTSIGDYAYGCDWCKFSLRAQKLLMLIMVRSQRPCLLTAGKVYIMNMENFSSVIQTSVSYFTVLSSMR